MKVRLKYIFSFSLSLFKICLHDFFGYANDHGTASNNEHCSTLRNFRFLLFLVLLHL